MPVPSPPHRCAEGHSRTEDECLACQDLDSWSDAFRVWIQSDEYARWMDMDDAEEALWAELRAKRAA